MDRCGRYQVSFFAYNYHLETGRIFSVKVPLGLTFKVVMVIYYSQKNKNMAISLSGKHPLQQRGHVMLLQFTVVFVATGMSKVA